LNAIILDDFSVASPLALRLVDLVEAVKEIVEVLLVERVSVNRDVCFVVIVVIVVIIIVQVIQVTLILLHNFHVSFTFFASNLQSIYFSISSQLKEKKTLADVHSANFGMELTRGTRSGRIVVVLFFPSCRSFLPPTISFECNLSLVNVGAGL
jgi:hypothetical protein